MFFACVSQRSGLFFQLTGPQLGSQQSTSPGWAVGCNLTSIPNLPTLLALGKTVGSASRVSCSYLMATAAGTAFVTELFSLFPFPPEASGRDQPVPSGQAPYF